MGGETMKDVADLGMGRNNKKFYPVGSEVWHCIQTTEDMGLAILCTVTETEALKDGGAQPINTLQEAIEADAAGYVIFYWLDEPIGHALTDDELYEKKEDFLVEKENSDGDGEHFTPNEMETLEGWRDSCLRFIRSTHGPLYGKTCPNDCCKMSYEEWVKDTFAYLRDKKEGEEWFRISCE